MFTGLVEEIGMVMAVEKSRTGVCLKIKTQGIGSDVKIGDSIAINGACLSVTYIKNNIIGFDVIYETLGRTTIGELKINDHVNLEKSLRPDSRIGGHFVTGHVDYKGRIEELLKVQDGTGFKIAFPDEYSKFIVEKGSVTVDGVSLTVANCSREAFTVYLIPHTLKVTTFSRKKKGDIVNVETDILAKYISKQTSKADLSRLLKKYDYI